MIRLIVIVADIKKKNMNAIRHDRQLFYLCLNCGNTFFFFVKKRKKEKNTIYKER